MSVVTEIAAQAAKWGEVAGNAFTESYENAETAEKVVEQILEAEARASDIEVEGSPYRWRVADGYLELSGLGWSVREIGSRFGKSKSAVARFIAVSKSVPLVGQRPSFWTAFQEVVDKAHVGPLTRAHAKMESELLRITERRTRLQGRALALPPGPERAKCLQLHRRESRKLRDQLARIRAELGLPPE